MAAFPIRAETFRFTVLLGVLAALPSLSIDINAPTLLVVQQQFRASSGLVGLTISLFMVGFALGQFGAGPLSDRAGRRPILLSGLGLYTIAAFGCAMSADVHALVAWRLLQGVGAGACTVLASTIIQDLFAGDAARTKRSYVAVVLGLAPMLAPSMGAWVLERAGWRPIYIILALGGLAMLAIVALGVAESRPRQHGHAPAASITRAYGRLLHDRRFLGLAGVNALSYGCIFAYIAGSPVALMGTVGLSASGYGVFFACTAAALTAGAWVSGRCARKGVQSRKLLWLGLTVAAGSALALAMLLMAGKAWLGFILPILLINLFCRGITAPSAQHLALEPIQVDAGSAAAFLGVTQILAGALSSASVAALLPSLGPLGMASVMATLAVGSLLLWIWISTTSQSYETDSAVAAAESRI